MEIIPVRLTPRGEELASEIGKRREREEKQGKREETERREKEE